MAAVYGGPVFNLFVVLCAAKLVTDGAVDVKETALVSVSLARSLHRAVALRACTCVCIGMCVNLCMCAHVRAGGRHV